MPTLKVTENQLRLIQNALDFYSRVGIGQMEKIADHPTFEHSLRNRLRPNKKFEIGDKTERGEIVEIGDGFIKTRGSWGNGEQIRTWTDVDQIKHSIDYSLYHEIRKTSTNEFMSGRNRLLMEDLPFESYHSIHSPEVDDSCRVAFDLIQVIRHEFWKKNPNKSSMTVDSSVHLWTSEGHEIKCSLEDYK